MKTKHTSYCCARNQHRADNCNWATPESLLESSHFKRKFEPYFVLSKDLVEVSKCHVCTFSNSACTSPGGQICQSLLLDSTSVAKHWFYDNHWSNNAVADSEPIDKWAAIRKYAGHTGLFTMHRAFQAGMWHTLAASITPTASEFELGTAKLPVGLEWYWLGVKRLNKVLCQHL
jgi:hypothetical protein